MDRGTNKGVSFGEVALKAYIPHEFPTENIEPGLEETAFTTQPTLPIHQAYGYEVKAYADFPADPQASPA